ncbi:cysteine dioxygenase family protein [Oscillatoria salina]|uniref:cysteine dioxygenase family protein n=1 Tax=Oscillatoria salina TaxID=331517 RepID=UPI001CD021BC|nr:cupin [Oscillatoria salina]MBZ8180823.1 cupin [Oscillatoria salina IIICB1]
MKSKDWLVKEDGKCLACETVREWDLLRNEYRLYRFLTEVEDVVNEAEVKGTKEEDFLPELRKLVRSLVMNNYWIKTQIPEPSEKTGVSWLMLYDELGFPLTVQTETILPGTISPIHNHGTWGVVAMLQGKQKNIFWQRSPTATHQDKITQVGAQILEPGDIISFTTEAIHAVEAMGDTPTVTFNIYGETFASKRFQFDPLTHQAKHF